MTEEIKQLEQAKEPTPGNIGDWTNQNSLAHKIVEAVEKAECRASLLKALFEFQRETCNGEHLDLDGVLVISEDILHDLREAGNMLCSPWCYRVKSVPGQRYKFAVSAKVSFPYSFDEGVYENEKEAKDNIIKDLEENILCVSDKEDIDIFDLTIENLGPVLKKKAPDAAGSQPNSAGAKQKA